MLDSALSKNCEDVQDYADEVTFEGKVFGKWAKGVIETTPVSSGSHINSLFLSRLFKDMLYTTKPKTIQNLKFLKFKNVSARYICRH